MDPIQAAKHPTPSVVAGLTNVAGKLFIGIGFLALALVVDPVPVYGESPAGESIAVTHSPSGAARNRPANLRQPASNERISLKIMPHTSGPLETGSARNLLTGFSGALERVRDIPSCRALFETLDASGVEMITNSFYIAPSVAEKRELCTGGVTAFTQVGSRVTRLCPGFGDVDRLTAALLLIHEALHSAGMLESPSTAGALTPSEINRLVRQACEL